MTRIALVIVRLFDSIPSIRGYQKALDAARRYPLKPDGLRGDGRLRVHLKIYINRSVPGSGFTVPRSGLKD
jgi:hypothetical protein